MTQTADQKVYALLGLCQKSGKLKSGAFAAEKSITSGRAALVLVTADASEQTAKRFTDKAAYYQVPCVRFGQKDDFGKAIGKELRSCAAIEDAGLAKAIMEKLPGEEGSDFFQGF